MLCKMEKKKSARVSKSKAAGAVLSMRLDLETEGALLRFISSQRVPPDKTSVGIMAIREFLQREGFWPPESSRK